MDDEQRQAFATLSAQMSEVSADARQATAATREQGALVRKVAASAITREDFRSFSAKMDTRFTRIEEHVGLPPGPTTTPPAPLVERVSSVTEDAAGLHGQVIAIDAKVETALAKVDTIEKLNLGQSKKQGVPGVANPAIVAITSNPLKFAMAAATLIAALASAGASCSGRPVPPAPVVGSSP